MTLTIDECLHCGHLDRCCRCGDRDPVYLLGIYLLAAMDRVRHIHICPECDAERECLNCYGEVRTISRCHRCVVDGRRTG